MPKSSRNRYSKNLFGVNHQGYHSAQQVYATAGTIAAFATSGLEGQIGVFLAAGTLKTTALSAGDQFVVAQIRDGALRKSVLMTAGTGNLVTTKTVSDPPVFAKQAVGYNGSTGSITWPTLALKQEFVISARDVTPGTQPFPVCEGRAVIKNTSVTKFEILEAIVNDMNNSYDFERNADNAFVNAEILSNGTQTAIGTATLAVASGSTLVTYSAAHSLSVGNYVQILGVLYKVITVPTTTTITLSRPFAGATQTALATGTTVATHGSLAYTDGTTAIGVRLTATTEDVNFVTAVGGELAAALPTIITAWKQGSGAAWQVSAIEDESIVYDGFTTGNYPFVEDFGKPTKQVSATSGLAYDLWFLKYRKQTPSMAFLNESQEHYGYVVISAPTTGNNPRSTLDTVFGT